MQFPTYIPNIFNQSSLDIHMYVFQVIAKDERALLDLIANGGERHNDTLGVLLRDDALLCQHSGVGNGAGDVLLIQALVAGDG